MDKYRYYYVEIRQIDHSKALPILEEHDRNGDIDEMNYTCDFKSIDGKRVRVVNYRICPYIYEDLETILNEFKQAGIQIL